MLRAPRLLLIAGTTSPGSTTSLLTAAFAREIAFLDAVPTILSLADYSLPLTDLEQPARSPPLAAEQLKALLRSHDGTFLAAPALAGGLPALLHNLLEWLAPAADASAVPLFAIATIAGNEPDARSALVELRGALTRRLGAELAGELAIGRSALAFDARGRIDDPHLAVSLQRLARQFVDIVQPRIDEM